MAIRMPDNPIAFELIRQCGCPVAAPSATFRKTIPTKENMVQDLMRRHHHKSCDCKVGIESTVLDLTGPVPTILRPGILTPEQLGQTLGKDVVIHPGILDQSTTHAGPNSGTTAGTDTHLIPPKSPGMKYTHYAPKAEMVILRGAREDVEREIERIRTERQTGSKVGLSCLGKVLAAARLPCCVTLTTKTWI